MVGRTVPRKASSTQVTTPTVGPQLMPARASVSATKTKPGMAEVVSVRVSSDRGSSTSRVRLASAARTTMAPRRTYLTRRRAVGTRPASRRAERNRSQPSSVPSGQIQPHHTRPSTSVTPRVMKARAKGASQSRAASIVASAASGSKRKKMFVSGCGSSRCRAAKSRYTKAANERIWTARRAQRAAFQPPVLRRAASAPRPRQTSYLRMTRPERSDLPRPILAAAAMYGTKRGVLPNSRVA